MLTRREVRIADRRGKSLKRLGMVGSKFRSLFTLVSRNAPHVPRSGDEHLACSRLRPPKPA